MLAFGGLVLVNLDRLKNVVGRRYKNMNLKGKVYIVTGSNTGIGMLVISMIFENICCSMKLYL